MTESSSARASRVGQAADPQLGQPASSSATPSRTEKTSATGSASRRRATKASVCAETTVQPLRIVDDADERLVRGGGGQQAQNRETDQEAVGRRPRALSERRGQRLALRGRQLLETVQQRRAELVQAGEGEFHFGFDARRARDPKARRALRQ